MIRPQPRLVVWTAVIAVPAGAAITALPAVAAVAAGLVALLVLVAVADLLAGRGEDSVAPEVPETVKLAKDREGVIPLVVRPGARTGGLGASRAILVPLPHGMEGEAEFRDMVFPGEDARYRVDWPCRPRVRGSFALTHCLVRRSSPLGLWHLYRRHPLETELRVFPNLLPERRHLAGLFLNRGNLGVHPQRRVGQGRDFEKLREYLPGDSFDDVHWKATAKRGRPVTKEYQIERTQEVYIAIDASRLSARDMVVPGRGDTEVNVLEYYLRAALILGLVAERQGDLFGVLTFSDRVHGFVRARNGKAHFDACRDTLYKLRARPVNPDPDEVCAFIRTRLRRRALVLFLTSLDDPVIAESFARTMDVVAAKHLVIAAMFRPPGAVPLFTQPTPDGADGVYRALGGHLRHQALLETATVLRRKGVRFSLLDAETMCTRLVSDYMNVKQRQLL